MAEKDSELFFYDTQSIKEEPRIIEQIIENEPFYYAYIDVKIEHEVIEEDGPNTDLLILNSKKKNIHEKNLYEDHTIKEELVLGPEIIQSTSTSNDNEKFESSIHNKLFTCDLCTKNFNSKNQVICHIKKSHGEVYCKKSCVFCNRNTKKYNEYPYTLSCKKCDKKLSMKKSFVERMKSHNDSVTHANKICDICGKKFASAQGLKRHLNVVHTGKKPFICNECGKSYRDKGDFQYHCLKTHSSYITAKQNFSSLKFCQYCDDVFVGKSRCSFHETYHCIKNKNVKKFVKIKKRSSTCISSAGKHACDICKKEYRYKSTLNQHVKMHLGTNNIYQCDICSKKYTKKANLKSHIQSVHMNLRVYSCDKCNKTYTSLWAVKCHKRKQCPVKKHECNICHKCYKIKRSLQTHIKNKHCA